MDHFGANVFDDAPPPRRPAARPAAATLAVGPAAATPPPTAAGDPAASRAHPSPAAAAASRPRGPGDPAAAPARCSAAARGPRATPAAPLAVLVDYDALEADARAQGGELVRHRLRQALAGERPVIQAVVFHSGAARAPAGFDLERTEPGPAAVGRRSAVARALAGSGRALLLAPATPAMHELAAALRADGHEVQLAGFTAGGPGIRRLGRDCMFVP